MLEGWSIYSCKNFFGQMIKKDLLQSSNVLAVLPARFGTSFIFQPFAAAAAIERNQRQTMLVVC